MTYEFDPGDGAEIAWEGGRWHRVTGPGVPPGVLVRFGRSPRGTFSVTGVMLGADGQRVQTRDLRIPLRAITEEAVRQAETLAPGGAAALLAPLKVPPRPAVGGIGPAPADRREEFARAYEKALEESPTRPVRAVVEQIPWLTRPTAQRWLSDLRNEGRLP